MWIPPWSSLGEDWRVAFPPPVQPFKFCLLLWFRLGGLGLKGRLFPCLGVEHSLQLCPEASTSPTGHTLFILFGSLKCSGWVLTISIGFEPCASTIFVQIQIGWLVTADIK